MAEIHPFYFTVYSQQLFDLSSLLKVLLIAFFILFFMNILNILYFRHVFYRINKKIDKHKKEIKNISRTANSIKFDLDDKLLKHGKREFRQIESFYWLVKELNFYHRMPWLRSWIASPDLLLKLYETIRERKPQVIVELGSGFSTLVIAKALHKNECGTVISLDHLKECADQTNKMLKSEGLLRYVDLRVSELVDLEYKQESFCWYNPKALEDINNIDLLFIDGPPGKTCKLARYPALPYLHDKMNKNALILLDDANRRDEKETVKRWSNDYPIAVELHQEYDKGLAIIILI